MMKRSILAMLLTGSVLALCSPVQAADDSRATVLAAKKDKHNDDNQTASQNAGQLDLGQDKKKHKNDSGNGDGGNNKGNRHKNDSSNAGANNPWTYGQDTQNTRHKNDNRTGAGNNAWPFNVQTQDKGSKRDKVDRRDNTGPFDSRHVDRRDSRDRFGTRPGNWNHRQVFDARKWRRNHYAQRRFHWNIYVRPHGWYSHRWVYGEILPVLFWSHQYRLNDWWMFDLPMPPRGYEWVRYGDDALLVNIRTGEIVDVVYDVFW